MIALLLTMAARLGVVAVCVVSVASPAFADCQSVRAFGAVADGKADDTSAIQSAVRAVVDARLRGGSVCLPAGDYRITRTIVISDVQGIQLIGDGGSTRLVWDGDDKSPLLLLSSVSDGEFRDFQIIGTDAKPLDVAIQCITGAGARLVSRHNMFVDLRIDGITGGVRKGIRIGGSGPDANNDFHLFQNIAVANYRDVAFSLENSQVFGIMFVNCLFEGNANGQVGVATDRAGGKGGNFSWIGGGGGGNQVADFSIGDPNNGPVSITDAIFERSARFVKTGGPSGASFLFRVEGVRWSGDALAADGIAIDFRFPGPLSIRGSRIGEDATKALSIAWNPGGEAATAVFIFEGNVVKRASATPLFVGRQPTRFGDNVVF